MAVTRRIRVDDATALAALMVANRDFLAPWDPVRPEEFFTEAGQRTAIEDVLAEHERGGCLPQVILAEDGRVVGRITLHGIVRRAFLSCGVGYWVSGPENGRGLASTALAEVQRIAFEDLGLHRIQAETLLHNGASQRVLARNGFQQIGIAPSYLKIAGRWQDHLLFQSLTPAGDL